MRIDYSQSILTYLAGTSGSDFLQLQQGYVSLLASSVPFTFVVTHGPKDYVCVIDRNCEQVWGPATSSPQWLYVDVDLQTAQISFGQTSLDPVIGNSQPITHNGLHWYNSDLRQMYVYEGGAWVEKLRLFVAQLVDGKLLSVSIDAPKFTGTSGGLSRETKEVGYIAFDANKRPIKDSSGHFITTTSHDLLGQLNGLVLNPVVTSVYQPTDVSAPAFEPIVAGQIVSFNAYGSLIIANESDISKGLFGVAHSSVDVGSSTLVSIDGVVTSPLWNFHTADFGSLVYVTDGGWPSTDSVLANRTPIGVVFGQHAVMLRPKTQRVIVEPGHTATPSRYGLVKTTTANDVVVSSDDPILTSPKTPTPHTHNSSAIVHGGEAVDVVLNRIVADQITSAGGNVTGVLSVPTPTAQEAVANKAYVDATVGNVDHRLEVHTHPDIVSEVELHYAKIGHAHAEYSAVSHTHSGYASFDHTHAGYATADHQHVDYARAIHVHAEYASNTHNHNTSYALINHAHNNYASVTHTHQLSDFGIVFTAPSVGDVLQYDGTGWKNLPITTSFASIAAKPSSLAGYGITDAYTKSDTDARIAAVIGTAPAALDTLGELAAQLQADASGVAAITTQLANKADTSHNHTIDALANVNTVGKSIGQVLTWSGTEWTAQTVSFSLPKASSTVLGGVKLGTGLVAATDGTVSVTGVQWTSISNKPTTLAGYGIVDGAYTLPQASGGVLGGIKVGTGLTIAADGTLSVMSIAPSWAAITGKPTTLAGYGITDGFVLQVASSSILGGVKVGSGLSIAADGTLSAVSSTPTWSSITGKPTTVSGYGITDISVVGRTGAYSDLSGKPSFALVATSGSYTDLMNKPNLANVATTGAYGDLVGKPVLAPVAFSGAYGDISGAPAPYVLPVASPVVLGGVKVGTGLTVSADGTVSAQAGVVSVNGQTGAVATPYDIGGAAFGTIKANAVVYRYLAPRTVHIAANAPGSLAKCAVAATATTTLTVSVNDVAVGSISFAPGNLLATISFTQTTLTPGDVLSVTGPATADATLANLVWTFVGTLG